MTASQVKLQGQNIMVFELYLIKYLKYRSQIQIQIQPSLKSQMQIQIRILSVFKYKYVFDPNPGHTHTHRKFSTLEFPIIQANIGLLFRHHIGPIIQFPVSVNIFHIYVVL